MHYMQSVAGGLMSKSISALDSSDGDSGTMKIWPMAPGDLNLLERRIPSLSSIVASHRRNAADLLNALEGGSYSLPLTEQSVMHDWYLFPLRFGTEDERRRAQARLQKAGIDAFQLYHIALHKSRQYGYRGDCPNSEKAAKNAVMLPVHPKVSRATIKTMRDELRLTKAGMR